MSQLQVTGEAKIRDIQGPVVANSGVITALDGAASQYVRGDGTLADFPTSSGGGSSVSYYLNSSVSQGTIGGVAYRELSKEPIIGAGTDISISANGYVASYLTDANDPDVLSIPGGNFNCEFYFSVNNNTGNPFFYAELYKYDGTTFTLLGSSVGVPEYINQGTIIAPYYFAIPVATAPLALTDRLAIRIYVNVDGRTVTLHTENGHLCQVVTTLSKGMVSLNNLTDQSQFLTTGTSGTNFTIASSGDTHTFNLPIASATNTGKLSSTDWSTFNNKQAALSFTAPLVNTSNTISIPAATSLVDGYLDNLDWVKFNTAYNDSIISAAVTGTTTKTLTLNQQDGGTITASWTDDNTDAVTSVFGRTGAVVAVSGDYNTSQVTENTNLYFTNARSRAALSFTAGSGAYNSTTGVITIPTNTNQLTNGASFITLASLSAGTGITYNNTTGVISSTITQYTDALARASLSFAAGSGAYNSTTGVITIPTNNNQITNGAGYITSSALSGYVPYTGATGAVNLGANNLTAQIGFFTNAQTFFANISTDGNGGYIQAYRASDNTYHPFRIFAGSGTTAIKSFILNNTGATLDVALNGTSANFTSSVNGLNYTMGNWNTINYTASIMQIGGISASQWQQIDFYTAGNLRATINSEGVTNFFRSVTTTSFFQTIGSGTYLRAGGYIWAGGSGGDYGSVGYNIGYNSTTSGSYTYVVNDLASMVRFENGGFNFLTAPTGAIGDAITFTPRVRFLNNGNILIGSNSDAGTKLYVNGTGRFDGNLSVQGALTANTGTGAIFRAVYAADGVVEIGNYGSLGYRQLDIVGSVINLGTGTAGGGSFTNRLTISALGVSTFSNTVIVNGQLSSNSLVVRNFSGLNDVAFIGSRSDWTSGPANLEMAIGSYRPSITFFTNNSTTERMRLTAVGRLGLGTDNPTSLLHIYGADPFLRIGNTSAGDQGIKITYLNDDTSSLNLLYNPNVATAWIENTYVQTAGQPWGDIHIRQNVGGTMTTRMLFKNIANSIYIGTTTGVSGGGALQVNGNVNINGVFQINGTTIGGGGGSGVTGSGTTNYVSKWTGASTLGNSLIFDTGSYVSMNTTTNPNLGGFTNTTLLLRQVADGATGGGLQIQANGSDNVAFFGFTGSIFRIGTSYRSTGSYQPIVLQTSGSDNLRIENSGNILINTATDNGYKLQINGSASFAFGFLSIFRGSTGANDILVGNDGNRFYIGGNEYVAGSVTATGGFFDTSDSRLKILIKDYEQPKGIENVAARMYVKNSRKELGYFAQDLQEILPSAVSEGEDGFLTLSYSQVHTAKIAYLEKEVAELKELIKSLL
jgi:hypothetical protein